ncbi:transglycosylase domain-containing protein [Faecalimonas sp.]
MNYGKKNASKKQREITSKAKMQKKRIFSRLFKSIILCILLIGIVGIIGVGFFVKKTIDNAPNISPANVKPTGYTTFVVDKNGKEIEKFVSSGSNRVYKTFDEIPVHLRHAFIAIEDSRFYQHKGIDLKGIVRAGIVGVTSGNFSEGASTITQQLIKNTVFPDFMNEDSFFESLERKIQEQYLALEIEKQMDKDLILENYMNTINLGQNTLGVQAASKRYFNKDVSQLTLSECATIAGITQSPSTFNPVTNPKKNEQRRKKVLTKMMEQELITQAEYDEALADDVYARIQNVNTQLASSDVDSYFIDALADQVIEDLQRTDAGYPSYSETQAINALYSGGLTIYATQDSSIQKIVDEEMNNDKNYPSSIYTGVEYALTITRKDGTQENYSSGHLKKFGKEQYKDKQGLLFSSPEKAKARIEAFKASLAQEGDKYDEKVIFSPQPQASAVIMDQYTGEVKALVGGRGKKQSNRSLNRATGSLRQPGSAFKIVTVYAPALDSAGQSLGTVTKDEPFERNGKSYKNAYNGFKGNVTMRTAIQDSVNISALKTFEEITPQLGFEYSEKLGITSLVKSKKINGKVYSDLQLPTALGGITDGVSNLEMTGAYAAIANGGVYNSPIFYTKILDHEGNVLIDNTSKSRTALRESTAYLLTSAMEDVVKQGTGKQATLPNMPVAGKTGTTTSRVDIWFCGYTPYYTCSVWVGFDDNKELPSGNYNQKLWKGIMSRIHKSLPYKDFEIPNTVAKRKVCSISGKVADSSCPYHMEYIALDGGSDKVCSSHAGYAGSVGGITHEPNKTNENTNGNTSDEGDSTQNPSDNDETDTNEEGETPNNNNTGTNQNTGQPVPPTFP